MKSPVILSFLFLVCAHTHAGVMTKNEAYEILKSQGFKWNMTETLGSDAEAKTQEAQSEFRPRVGLGFRQYVARINPIQYGSTAAQTIDTVGFGTTAIEMSWTLMDSLAKAKLLSAQANEKMSATQTKHFQNELTALMLIQYLNVQRLKQQLDVMDANINKSNLIFKLATARRSVGAGIQLDVARSKNLLKLDQLKKIAIYTKYMKAKHELALSLSVDKLDSDLEVLKPVLLPARDYKSSLAKTLDSRPDLKTAELGLQAAVDLHSETHKFIFPKLQLLAELGTTQPTLFGMPPTTLNGILGVSLSIPLLTGGLIDSKRKESVALQTKADLNYRQTKAEIILQMKEALEQLIAAEEALKASEDYLKTSEEEAQIAESRYKSGGSNILDLTNAHTNLATAHDTKIENIFNYEAAKVGYFRTLGDFSEYFDLAKGERQ